jgi:hypothetical protein
LERRAEEAVESVKLKETKKQRKKVWAEEFRVFARVFQSLMVPLML